MYEMTFHYQGYNIVFTFQNENDLRVMEAMQTKLGAFKKSSSNESIQNNHLCFKLHFVGERLDMDIEKFTQKYLATRGPNCLSGMTLYMLEDSRTKSLWNIPAPQLFTFNYDRKHDPRHILTPASVEKLLKHIDDTIQNIKTETVNKKRNDEEFKTDTNNNPKVQQPAPVRGKFEDFKAAYYLAYRKAFFKNPFSLMKRCLDKNMIFSMEQIEEYAKRHPKTRTATVLKSIRP